MPVLNNTLSPAPLTWTDPYEQQRAALMARMQAEPAPMFSPEEQEARVAQNNREYQLGLLAQMSGDEALAPVGGMVLKNALANRHQQVSERGTTDPLRGKFTYSPEYLNAQRQAQLDRLDTGSAASRERYDRELREEKRDAEARRERAEYARQLKAMSGGGSGSGIGVGGSQVGAGPGGEMIFRDKGGRLFTYGEDGGAKPYAGKLLPKPSSANASEDERKAAGWSSQAAKAYSVMQEAIAEDPNSSKLNLTEAALGSGMFPGGEDIAYARMSPARQRFTTAASSLSEAVLRAATGAGQNEAEAKQKVREITPRWGEHPSTTAMKQQMAENYLRDLEVRAGRALNKPAGGSAAAPGGVDPADPLGLFKGKPRGGQ